MVTKPEPLPPLDLTVSGQRLGANLLEWKSNVEQDLSGYRLSRRRADGRAAEVVATLPHDATRVLDNAVGADEAVDYELIAVDSDGLESAASRLAVESVGYELSATAQAGGILLTWNPRIPEGWAGGRIYLQGLRVTELGFSSDGRFVHLVTESGKRYRYVVVLEAPDGTPAPSSAAVEIERP